MEVKFGFVPGQDTTAYRVRRRFRLLKGGHLQLVLIHYSRGQPMGTCLRSASLIYCLYFVALMFLT